jgi:hypothetical protein
VDLFGDHPVQVAQASLEAAIVLALAMLFVLLSVRVVARRSAWKPMPATVTPRHTLRLAWPGRDDTDIPSARRRALGTSLPTRAPPQPPDPAQRFCPAPSGRFRRRRMT